MRPKLILSAMSVLACVALPVAAGAQEDSAFAVRTVDTRDGLSSNTVFAIRQDRSGFLWVGTIDGLNRYDGAEFQVFRNDPDDPDSLSNNSVRQVWEDAAGQIWVRTGVGTDRYDPATGVFHHYHLGVFEFAQDSAGRMLAAAEEGLFRYDPTTDAFEPFSELGPPVWPGSTGWVSPFAQDPVWRILRDGAENTWIGTDSGVIHRVAPDGSVTSYQSPWRPATLGVEDEQGLIWFGHSQGVSTFDPRTETFARPAVTAALTRQVLPVLRDRNGTVWLGGDRLYRMVPGGLPVPVVVDDGPAEQFATRFWQIRQDHEGGIWLATAAGLRRVDPRPKPFENLVHEQAVERSPPRGPVAALDVGPGGELWAATILGGVLSFDGSGTLAEQHDLADGPCHPRTWAVEALHDAVWLGTASGLCRLDRASGSVRRVSVADEELRADNIQALVHDRGTLWIGGLEGLFWRESSTGLTGAVELIGNDGTPAHVQSLWADTDGALWIGSTESDVFRISAEREVTRFPTGSDPTFRGSEGFWAIARNGENLWLGSDRGLFELDPATGDLSAASLVAGVTTGPVYTIRRDGSGSVWLSTHNGLLRFADPGASGQTVRRYTESEGLAHPEFNRRAAAVLPTGELAFGSLAGITLVRPERLHDNPHAPRIVFHGIDRTLQDGTQRTAAAPIDVALELPYHDTGLTIRYAGLTYGDPARTRYAYRLVGFDTDWFTADATRFARYPALPPGNYTFTVRAANADGVWNLEGASFQIVVAPPWWETTWARAIAAILILGTVAAAARQLSNRALRRRVRKLEFERHVRLERERISRDLHDNVGASVSTFLAGVELAQLTARSGADGDVEQHLSALEEEAHRTMEQLHETVWSLNRERVSVRELGDQIVDYLDGQQRFHAQPGLSFSIGKRANLALGSAEALNLFRVAQEAVRNAIRHAAAEQVRVELDASGSRVELTISDDGTFDEPTGDDRGHGIAGMGARAARLGTTLVRQRNSAGGTTVQISIDTEADTRKGGLPNDD